MTIRGLQRLLMIQGHKVAADYREIIEAEYRTFTRVMAGDQSLIEVINANAASQAPVQQAFRAALAQEPVAPVLDEACLGKKREHNEISQDLLADRKLRLEEAEFRLKEREMTLEHLHRGMELIDSLKARNNTGMDEQTKLQFEDHIKNVFLSASSLPQRVIPDGAPVESEPTLFVSDVAKKMGYACLDRELISIGRLIAKKFRAKHNGEEPSKRGQKIQGAMVQVNSYTEQDRDLVEQAVREIMSDASESGDT
jgi:hypothetical protein